MLICSTGSLTRYGLRYDILNWDLKGDETELGRTAAAEAVGLFNLSGWKSIVTDRYDKQMASGKSVKSKQETYII